MGLVARVMGFLLDAIDSARREATLGDRRQQPIAAADAART